MPLIGRFPRALKGNRNTAETGPQAKANSYHMLAKIDPNNTLLATDPGNNIKSSVKTVIIRRTLRLSLLRVIARPFARHPRDNPVLAFPCNRTQPFLQHWTAALFCNRIPRNRSGNFA